MKSLFKILQPQFEDVNKAVTALGGLQFAYEVSGWLDSYFQKKVDFEEGVLFDPWFAVVEPIEPLKDDKGEYKAKNLFFKVLNPENPEDFYIMGLGATGKKGGPNRFGSYFLNGGFLKQGGDISYRAPQWGERCIFFYKGQKQNEDGDSYHDWSFRFAKSAPSAFPEQEQESSLKRATKRTAAAKKKSS